MIGTIPEYTAGTLYRTGPGGYKTETVQQSTYAASHWFDGFAQVHRFQIIPGVGSNGSTKVVYNSRHTVDKFIEEIKQSGSTTGVTFGQKRDPCESYFKKVMSVYHAAFPSPRAPSAHNVGVTMSVNMPGLTQQTTTAAEKANGHASGISTLFTQTDANIFQRIHPETLEPLGIARQQKLHPELKGPLSAAHAKSDPINGDVFNFNLELGRTGVYRVFQVSAATGKTKILAKITAPPAYIHSFFLTRDHVVLCVWNSYLAKGGLPVIWQRNVLDVILPFEANRPSTWYVIDRKHDRGLLATYEGSAFFSFHTVNAWTEKSPTDASVNDIVADLLMYDNLDVLKSFYYENLIGKGSGYNAENRDSSRSCLRRFRLPAVPTAPTTAIRQVEIDFTTHRHDSPELPTINPSYLTKPHRYTYGVCDRGLSSFMDGLVKFDNETRQPTYWSIHAHSPGEPIFVADPQGTREDDGVLLSVVLDGLAGHSYLLCLDARTMTEMGRAEVDGVVGFGFHGCHVASNERSNISML